MVISAFALAGLFSNSYVYAQTEKLGEITTKSYQNTAMLKEMIGAVEACTAGMLAYDTAIIDSCANIISNTNTHLKNLLSESKVDIDTVVSKYGYRSGSSSSYGVDSLY